MMPSVQRSTIVSSIRSLRINGIIQESIVDGPGIRYVIFVQGCPHHCPGCHNPQTHDFEGGTDADTEEILSEIRENPLLRGVTFSGGEPFCQPSVLARMARTVHAEGLDVVTYTGYLYEQLEEMAARDKEIENLLKETDILIDGPFLIAERDLSLLFRGSRNQRILNLKEMRSSAEEAADRE